MTNQLKKMITRSFLLLALLGLAACGGDGNGNDTPPGTNPPGTNPPGTNPPAGTTLAAVNDAYTWLGNSQITVPAANGVLANDTLATGVVPGQKSSAQLGTVNLAADGSFTYEAPRAYIGTDTFTYTATDAAGATATGTVSITINQRAWYVKNDAIAGQGTTTNPFNTLSAAMAVAGPGDTIFVFTGNPATVHNGAITLLANQKLIGQGVGLTFDILPANPDNPLLPIDGIVATPLTPPVLTRTAAFVGNAPVIALANNVEVAGFIIDGTGTAPANGLMGMSGTPVGFNIHDNTIRNLPRAAIQLLGTTGGTGMIVNNTFANILGANPDNAVDIVTTAAGINFTITGNTLNNVLDSGIRVQFGSGNVVVSNNTLTNIGTIAGGRGIDVDGAGTATISANTVDNTGVAAINRSGIQVNASGTLAASVTGNTVVNAAPADGGIQAQTTILAGSLCLRMTGNTTANNFILDNRSTNNLATNFRIEGPLQTNFEAANTGAFTYLVNVAAVSFVPVGTCGFAP